MFCVYPNKRMLWQFLIFSLFTVFAIPTFANNDEAIKFGDLEIMTRPIIPTSAGIKQKLTTRGTTKINSDNLTTWNTVVDRHVNRVFDDEQFHHTITTFIEGGITTDITNIREKTPLPSQVIALDKASLINPSNRTLYQNMSIETHFKYGVNVTNVALKTGYEQETRVIDSNKAMHLFCNVIPKSLLARAANQDVVFISTLDTLSKCTQIEYDTKTRVSVDTKFLYNAEVKHSVLSQEIETQALRLIMAITTSKLATSIDSANRNATQREATTHLIMVKR